jgi:chromosome segregation ATPase
MSSPSVTQATRRRQRSTRVTVAIGLLLLAALGVSGAVVAVESAGASWLLLAGASALAVALGATATRITHTELTDSRRAAAADRAQLAQGYSHLTAQRAVEHASYVSTIESRITARESMLEQIEMALSAAQRRAATATRKKNAESRRSAGLQAQLVQAEDRATDAMVKVHELENELVTLRAELDAVTAAWHAAESVRRHA